MAFKHGFISRCIEAGITTPEQMCSVVKTALDKRADIVGAIAGGVKNVVGGIAGYGIPLALAAPPVVGGVLGHLASRASDIDDTDVDDARNSETVDTYRREAARLRREGMLRQSQAANKGHGHRSFF